MTEAAHIPVLLHETLAAMVPKDGGLYIDGTFGAGGYSRAILEAADCRVAAFDRDDSARATAREFGERYGGRFRFFNEKFSEIPAALAREGIGAADGLALDLGVSSMQIDTAGRGFSFRLDGPLSMAMGKTEIDAAEFLNTARESEIADAIYRYGEEPRSHAIAKKIIASRPLSTTFQLAAAVKSAVGARDADKSVPRVFQAIRIYVNDELSELELLLAAAAGIIKPGGRLAVVSFHSLEDRIVKNFMRPASGTSRYSPGADLSAAREKMPFKTLWKNAIIPTEQELSANPRARSAKLRAAVRN